MDITDRGSVRLRFHELGKLREQKLAVSVPLRQERDQKLAIHQDEIRALEEQIRQAEQGLSEIDRERGMLARALGGQTGEPT